MILPLDECRRILGPAAEGVSDDDLMVIAVQLERFAEWAVEELLPIPRQRPAATHTDQADGE